jgi:Plasmid encoded RepA protein
MEHVADVAVSHLKKQVKSRESSRLSPTAKKIAEGAVAVRETMPGEEDIAYFHSVLTQVSLPRRSTKERVFERTSGNVSLRLSAGALWKPSHQKWVEQPLPSGSIPRYLWAWLNTYAIRNRTNEVLLGDSARDFMEKIGYSVNGGKRGTYTSFLAQARALVACQIQLGLPHGTFDGKVTETSHLWMEEDTRQRSLWPNRIVLAETYCKTLQEHAVPLSNDALLALRNNSLALDIYAWLAQRLHRVQGRDGQFVSWASLKQQFGDEYAEDNDGRANFKKEFLRVLKIVKHLYPGARVQECFEPRRSKGRSSGLTLLASPPPIAKLVR